jgi:hypothetical protein
MKRIVLILSCLLVTASVHAQRQLWLYYPTNLLVEKNVDKLAEIWKRAADSGYTHVLLADSKFSRLGQMDKRYFDNVERTKKIAAELKLTIVPAMFSVGYSNDLLNVDPNLAEGLAVKDALFVVKDNVARLEADPAVGFKAKWGFVDEFVKVEGNTATIEGHSSNARMNQKIKVSPYRHYHVSVEIKTADYTGKPEIKALAGGGVSLQWTNLGVKKTQDWKTHHVTFNSLNNSEVAVYLGSWGSAKGTLQWRNWKIEEVGLMNVLRRPGAPLVVKAGDKALEEGKDFEAVKDPAGGTKPWPGEWEVWHESPAIKTKGLADGTQLRVSWYHPHIIYDGQVTCCPSEPGLVKALEDQAGRMKKLWGESAGGWMMSHDEVRCLNQDASCLATGKTPGQILADNVRLCTKLLEGKPTYVWNDMFDPHHNAVKGPYYLVNGDLSGAWEGLDKSVIIMQWNFGKRDASLKFFADRGHKQVIAGYYDDAPEQIKTWLESAAKVEGVVGVMYTTWRNDYSQVEAFAKLAQWTPPKAFQRGSRSVGRKD